MRRMHWIRDTRGQRAAKATAEGHDEVIVAQAVVGEVRRQEEEARAGPARGADVDPVLLRK